MERGPFYFPVPLSVVIDCEFVCFFTERMGSSSLVIVLCLAGAAVVLLVIILLVIYKLKYDRLKVGPDFKGKVQPQKRGVKRATLPSCSNADVFYIHLKGYSHAKSFKKTGYIVYGLKRCIATAVYHKGM